MSQIAKFVLSVVFLIGFSAVHNEADGDTIVRNASGDWATLSEWNNITTPANSRLPVAGDNAILNGNRSATVSTVITGVPDIIQVNNQLSANNTDSTLTVGSAGSITAGQIFVGANGSAGHVVIQGGGSLTATNRVIVGNTDGLHPSSLDFVLDANGFTNPFMITNNLIIRNGQCLNIDASMYTSTVPASITLLNAATISGSFSNAKITVTGLGAGESWTVDQNAGGSGDIVLNISAVPEPSSLALIGLSLVGFTLRRRR